MNQEIESRAHLRELMGYTTTGAAKAAGVSTCTLVKYECDRTTVIPAKRRVLDVWYARLRRRLMDEAA